MKRFHAMPFGAECRGRATRFALWAPASPRVRLLLGRKGERSIDMQAEPDGWHRTTVEDVRPGEAYAFDVKDGAPAVPDPASRSNPWDVDAPSAVVDPRAFEWDDEGWKGRPWNEAVVYELHVGAFTPEGTYLAAIGKLDHLAGLGVTAIELMPLAEFRGRRNWGYDGVLQFAPDAAYGKPGDLKRFIAEAHKRGLMVLLDVVYNHFGPEGNYLPLYAPQFFNEAHRTPWGAAINFDGDRARTVRDFFVHNTLYWLEEYHFDGVRMDAIHAIADDSPKHIVTEIAEAIAAGPGRTRHVHQVLENERNEARFLEPHSPHARAQWNDDAHHAFHVLLTGERDGYYQDYADKPLWQLGRTLAEGFAYQGEPSRNREGEPRGDRSAHLPSTAFVPFLQNHDQVGNRALGERFTVLTGVAQLRLARAALLLAPWVPLLFMGEELAATSPFLYFCDYTGELARAVCDGRRREFSSFARFCEPGGLERIPDPNAEETFLASKIDWSGSPEAADALAHHRELLRLRARAIAPRIGSGHASAKFETVGGTGLAVDWTLGDRARLHLRANFGGAGLRLAAPRGERIHAEGRVEGETLGPWSGLWVLEAP